MLDSQRAAVRSVRYRTRCFLQGKFRLEPPQALLTLLWHVDLKERKAGVQSTVLNQHALQEANCPRVCQKMSR